MTKNGSLTVDLSSPGSLPWWHDLVSTALTNPALDNRRAIFTNRSLRLSKIKAVGFDFDHTLATYNCEALDGLAMKLVIERLVSKEHLPADFVDDIPEPSFACKGLVVDIELGNVAKIDRFGHVVIAYHGKHRLTQSERRSAYGDADYIPHVTHGNRFLQVDSAFAKPEVLIFSALAPRMDEGGCKKLWKMIRHHTDMIHRDGSLKKVLMASPLDFLAPDLETVSMLRHLRQLGKKVFLLTNSEWEYTRAMMNTALGLGAPPDDLGWADLFDFVVCEAGKPRFFTTRKPKPFAPVEEHEAVACGGHIDELEERLGCGGANILYVGDHIYADLITSKRKNHWRTMLIIDELGEELEVKSGLPGIAMQIKQADDRRLQTEHEVHHWKALEAALDRFDDARHGPLVERLQQDCTRHRERSTNALLQYIKQRERLRARLSEALNPYWGSLFRAGSELTYYGKQLDDFACTYTSHASNIALYPGDHYFRSAMDYLPHELESM